MYQDFNGNPDSTSIMLPCIYEDKYLDVGVVPSYHDVGHIVLECQEDIDWDDVEEGHPDIMKKPKPSDVDVQRGHVIDVVIEEEDMNMYDDDQPASLAFFQSDHSKPGVLIQTSHPDSLLHLWRDTPVELADESAESTQVNLSEEDSEGFSLESEELSYCTSDGYSNTPDTDIGEIEQEPASSVPENGPSSFPECGVNIDQLDLSFGGLDARSLSPTNVSERGSLNASPVNVVPLIDDNVVDRTYYMTLRSVSPEIIRTPSPLSSRSSSPRFMRSPSPLEIIQSLAQVPAVSSHNIVFYDDRYILRTHSPVTTSDHEVPNVDLDYQSVVEASDEFPSYQQYQRSRVLRSSCFDDQVVPEFIEE